MARYIDADALAYIVASNGDADFINKVTKLMIDAPSIDIVRCKECIHNPDYTKDYEYGICPYCCEDDWYSSTPKYDFFCSYG